ncbi:aquaporin [Sphingobium sp. CAP-1]|uniref:aquaporin n=1 Tax=Sphingobium sp. CAP-1 TaxID=2676077 RepID=UPI0012BB2766|nr:aquaporin [Sphingobium sp. CAP-1]QGP77575.1 aquaporin family protein [Sphingobium sp. CAP-1]
MKRICAAEAIGTGLIVATVVGSGIMAARLSNGNMGIALLANSIATGAMLYLLITLFAPISGAHFNPAVTLLAAPRREWPGRIAAQIGGGVIGTMVAQAMFGLPLLQPGATARTGGAIWLAEGLATCGLLLTIRLGGALRATAVPALVAGWIVAAYWFTSSTSFANPAVTIARALTDSFAGIRPVDVPPFLAAQLAGALLGHHLAGWLLGPSSPLQTQESPIP